MKSLKILALTAVSVVLMVAVAGFIKFNFIDVPYTDDSTIYISSSGEQLTLADKADGSVEISFGQKGKLVSFVAIEEYAASGQQYVEQSGNFTFWRKGNKARVFDSMWQPVFTGLLINNQLVETIRFSQSQQRWFDDIGTCNTCTAENGFGQDGSVEDVIWQELTVGLKNDLGESPSTEEVQILFEQQYAVKPGQYPVHVNYQDDKFTVLVAVAKELKGIDLLDPRGALFATYEVLLD